MKHILRIYDFIRSWIYYPKMIKYLSSIGIEYQMSRLQYALWHCKTGKLSDTGYENLKPKDKNDSKELEYIFIHKPIERS